MYVLGLHDLLVVVFRTREQKLYFDWIYLTSSRAPPLLSLSHLDLQNCPNVNNGDNDNCPVV